MSGADGLWRGCALADPSPGEENPLSMGGAGYTGPGCALADPAPGQDKLWRVHSHVGVRRHAGWWVWVLCGHLPCSRQGSVPAVCVGWNKVVVG